jgi:hypothetical protein
VAKKSKAGIKKKGASKKIKAGPKKKGVPKKSKDGPKEKRANRKRKKYRHNKDPYYCKPYGGHGICQHDKRRSSCI